MALLHCRSGKETIEEILKLDGNTQLKVGVLLWRWWSARNKVNAGEGRISSQDVCSLMTYYATEFEKLRKPEAQHRSTTTQLWLPPDPDFYKINTDASFSARTGSGGWGFIARNNSGAFLEGGCGQLQRVSNPLQAEALAALKRLQRAAELGMSRIVLEIDASNLQNALTSEELDRSVDGEVLRNSFVQYMLVNVLVSPAEVSVALSTKRRRVEEPQQDQEKTVKPGKDTAAENHNPCALNVHKCGKPQAEEDVSVVAFGHIHKLSLHNFALSVKDFSNSLIIKMQEPRLGTSEIDRLRGDNLKNLLRERKLVLILDLDHTLINSTKLQHITHAENELGIRTIASKVISNSDCTQGHQKGLDVILGAESVAVILDDTEFVWQKHKENLILMERYHYFASS
ncbi:hypothetical protein PR202_gb05568 [Eleusine coracana subsp. coracana]|uniref:protein-serine/threonine phosphatase n=1 Tax=Eleusine coracana subsp. coracana TaxID=191504 RepID=A0AAV5E6P9_ELECO|nr:hypothetical protein PR202_gb05568 [Eleusine coracana subsp. coracana]